MAIANDVVRESIPYKDRPNGTFYQLADTSIKTYTVHESEHRVRPPEPLWKNPSPLGFRFTDLRTINLTKQELSYETRYYYNRGVMEHNWIGEIDTNWPMDLRNKVGELRANLSSAVAEIKETSRMFVDLALKLRDAKRVLKGKKRRKPLDFCAVSSAQLLVNFGLKPTIQDLYVAYGALKSTIEGKPVFRVVSKSEKSESRGFDVGIWKQTGKLTKSDRAIFYVEMQEEGKAPDLGDPAEWAWELIPFSFVVDWAIPVGDYIQSLSALAGFRIINGTVTTKAKYEGIVRNGLDYRDDVYFGTVSHSSYQRRVYTEVPMPSFPDFDPGLSWTRVANALSILHQLKSCR